MLKALLAASMLMVPVAAHAKSADPYAAPAYVGRQHVDWSRDAVIYQINTRQFTPEGTLKAAAAEIARLKELGVDILWLMPIHPIGEMNRKGTLGSPYAVKDYRDVNPELGTRDDLKAFVDAAHAKGMKVILDWVPNHTAWDHPWRTAHPDWYVHDWKGANVSTPWWDWSDIVDLDYSKPAMRREMAGAMAMWVRDYGIDGFRADTAGYVPPDFWGQVRRDLDRIKPVWMLGEFNHRDLHFGSFDASYGWAWGEALEKIGKGHGDTGAFYGFYSENESAWPSGAQRMIFLTNHDENAWNATEYDRFGPALANGYTLLFTSEGLPLIYNGQEGGNRRQLKFFEKDPIVWDRSDPHAALIRDWIRYRKAHRALDNAPWGGRMVQVKNSDGTKVFSFVRAARGDAVFVAQNYGAEPRTVTLDELPYPGSWQEKDGGTLDIKKGTSLTLAPWSSRVFSRTY